MKGADKLQDRLRTIFAKYAAIKANGVARTDSDKRLALRRTLGAVIGHLQAQPGFRDADIELLVKLARALLDTENGVSVSYLQPKRKRGPKPDPINIRIAKGRIAADVESKRSGGYYSQEEAAEEVRRKIKANNPVYRGTAQRGVETILRWHYNIPLMSEKSIERQAYEARLREKRRRIAR